MKRMFYAATVIIALSPTMQAQTDFDIFAKELETCASTNLALAVKERDPAKIQMVYEKMTPLANIPLSERKKQDEQETMLLKIQFQTLQALHTMQKGRSMANPLKQASQTREKKYDMWATRPEDIQDPLLKKEYEEWLEYLKKNPAQVSRDNQIEKMYHQRLMMLRPWAWDEKYTQVIKEAVKDKELLELLFDPNLNPKPTIQKTNKDEP